MTIKKITAGLILSTMLFTHSMLGVQAEGISVSNAGLTMEEAMEIASKVEKVNTQLETLIETYSNKVDTLLSTNLTNKTNLEKIRKILKTTSTKIDVVISLVKSKYSNSIYYGIYLKNFANFKVELNERLSQIDELLSVIQKTGTTTTQTIKIGSTPKEKEEITEQTIVVALSSNYDDYSNSNQEKDYDTLVANGLFTETEARIITLSNLKGDGFDFCANFTADIYTNEGLRYYHGDRATDAADQLKLWKNTYIPNRWKKGYTSLLVNSARIQGCIAQYNTFTEDYGYTQKDFAELYQKVKKYAGEDVTFTPWTTPFYKDGTTTDEFEAHVTNIDDYINTHHGW